MNENKIIFYMREIMLKLKDKIETPIITRDRFWFIQNKLRESPKIFQWVLKNR